FTPQGHWTEEEYLELATNRLVEFADGFVEVLPAPDLSHQWIVRYLFRLLDAFVLAHQLGDVYFAPLPMVLLSRKYREPDIIFLKPGRKQRHARPIGADLAMEVVSEGEENRRRDMEVKPKEYARVGIREYWIVDPHERQITVMRLRGKSY